MGENSSDRDAVELLADEFLARRRRGERPTVEDYAARHPDLAEAIRAAFLAMALVDDLGTELDAANHGALGPRVPPPGRVGDYRVLREVGRGGMGVVYEAEQVSLGRRVALKILSAAVASDRTGLARFRREARAAARLHHTNIVPVFVVGQDGEVVFYAMQFIEGQGLDAVIDRLAGLRAGPRETERAADCAASRRDEQVCLLAESVLGGRLSTDDPEARRDGVTAVAAVPADEAGLAPLPGPGPPDPSRGIPPPFADPSGGRTSFFRGVAQIGRQAAQGLAHAHARGIVHRDVKPSNVLLDTDGVVWITDFGLAKAEEEGLTRTGDILGTIRYMAPERFRGEGDARADVYALGLTLYELVTLRPAFDSFDRLRLVERINAEEPPRPRVIDARIPRDLETVVLKAIDKDPRRRYQTAGDLAEELHRFLAGEPIRARRVGELEALWKWARRRPAVATLGAALLLLFAALLGLGAWSYLRINQALTTAKEERQKALGLSRKEAEARKSAEHDRSDALVARNEALSETYHALLSETRALRLAREQGWRDDALGNLVRLATLPTALKDFYKLRTEAAACFGHLDSRVVAAFGDDDRKVNFWAIAYSPDGKTLALGDSDTSDLILWAVGQGQAGDRVRRAGGMAPFAFRPDGSCLAYGAPGNRVAFHPLRPGGAVPVSLKGPKPALALAFTGPEAGSRWPGARSTTRHPSPPWSSRRSRCSGSGAVARRGRLMALSTSPLITRPRWP